MHGYHWFSPPPLVCSFAEFIFSLEASDDFLKERVQNLPESVVEKMHYSKDEYLTRLKKFRKANVEDETVLNYFDELEIHPEHIGKDEIL